MTARGQIAGLSLSALQGRLHVALKLFLFVGSLCSLSSGFIAEQLQVTQQKNTKP